MAAQAFISNAENRWKAFPHWPRKAGDCVVRAITTHVGLPYEEVYRELASYMFREIDLLDIRALGYKVPRRVRNAGERICDHGVYNVAWRRCLMDYGSEVVLHIKKGKRGWTVAEIARTWPNCIIADNSHLACIKDGELHDSFNSALRNVYRWEKIEDRPRYRRRVRGTTIRRFREVWV